MIFVFLLLGILVILIQILKKKRLQLLYMLVYHNQNDSFLTMVDRPLTKALIPIFIREQLRLNVFISKKDVQAVEQQYNQLIKQVPNLYQKQRLLIQGFYFFVTVKKEKRCERILLEMKQVFSLTEYQKYKMHYEIVCKHNKKYQISLQKQLQVQKGKRLGYIQYLLSRLEEQENIEKSKQYKKQALLNLNMTEEQIEDGITII